MEKIAGTKSEITGMENLPEGSFILAPKHQSFWDAIAFFPYLRDPLYILKRELMWIPFFGWYIPKMRMIPVNRGRRSMALKAGGGGTKREMAHDRQLIIYPEGTRRAPGDEPAYKYGIVELYSQLGLPVVPVAHVAGLYWPRRKFLRHPGTIKARFLKPIPAGLGKDEFMRRLISETEAACDQMLVEASRLDNPPPFPADGGEAAEGPGRRQSGTDQPPHLFQPVVADAQRTQMLSVLSTYSSLGPAWPTAPETMRAASAASRLPAYCE